MQLTLRELSNVRDGAASFVEGCAIGEHGIAVNENRA